jgi:hypothetical protein
LTKGIDDAYRGTVPAGRYPPVALRRGGGPASSGRQRAPDKAAGTLL